MSLQADTRGVLNAFFRRWRLFLLFFVPINLAGAVYLLCATPDYESTAKLLVKFGQEARPDIASSQNNGGSSSVDEHHELVQSNVRILTSRDLAESLLNETTIEKAYPKIARHPPRRGTPMDAALKRLSSDLAIRTDNDSSIVGISLFNADPAMASAMLRRLIDLFITRQSEIYSNPQTEVLREEAEEAYHKLQDVDRKLHNFKAEAGIASIDLKLNLLLQQRGDIAGYLSRRPANDMQAIAYQPGGLHESGLAAIPAQIPTPHGDRFPVLDDVQKKIGDLRAHEAELLQTYTPDSDAVQNVRSMIGAETAAQNASVHALANQVADLDRQIADKDMRKSYYEDLMREVQLNEDHYKAAEARAEEAETDQDLNQKKITQISVIEQPSVPYKPSRPWKTEILVLCLLCSLAFGFAACIIAENLDRSFALPEQAAADLGIQVIASFPYRPMVRKAIGTARNRLLDSHSNWHTRRISR